MATLTDDTFFGASDASANTGLLDADVMTQVELAARNPRAQATATLNEIQVDAADKVGLANLRIELNNATDLLGLTEITQRFVATRAANAKVLFADPAQGERWVQAGGQAAQGVVDGRADELAREQEMRSLDGLLDGLRDSALQMDSADTSRLIDTGTRLINGARAAGYVDADAARAKQQHWVQNYAKAWTEMRPPEQRLALLGGTSLDDTVAPDATDATNGVARNTGTPADFIPPEDRARIRREAQAEIDRNKTQRLWQRSVHYGQSIELALQGNAEPSLQASIETDPDLDEPNRTRLLQQNVDMERELAAYARFKVRFDNPAGSAFDNHDADDQYFADKIYQRLGATPAALHAVVSRTGILPASGFARMQGDLASEDPVRVAHAVSQATRLNRYDPHLLVSGPNEADDLTYAAAQFRHYVKYGETPERAIQHVIEVRSPDAQAAWRAKLETIDVNEAVDNATSMFDVASGNDPISAATTFFAYRELVKDRYVATGDMPLAKVQAREQLQLLLGAIGGADDGGGGGDVRGGGTDDGTDDDGGRLKKSGKMVRRGEDRLPPVVVYRSGFQPPLSDRISMESRIIRQRRMTPVQLLTEVSRGLLPSRNGRMSKSLFGSRCQPLASRASMRWCWSLLLYSCPA